MILQDAASPDQILASHDILNTRHLPAHMQFNVNINMFVKNIHSTGQFFLTKTHLVTTIRMHFPQSYIRCG